MAKNSILNKIYNSGPLVLLYYLCISEVDTNLERTFDIFSLNFQIILIYFWVLKRPDIMANGHVFIAGLINDTVVGLPLGISSLSYILICISTSYLRNITIRPNPIKDWFYFLLIISLINSINYTILNLFFAYDLLLLSYLVNIFFTFIFYIFFSYLFKYYLKGLND